MYPTVVCSGVNSSASSYAQLCEMQEEEGGEDEVPEFLWIEVRHAASSLKKVMEKSGEDGINAALKQLAEAALESKVNYESPVQK